ncbi:MAG: hypothetical protein IJX38_04260 [Clostridia bacterium]|nr:hypothetical protein [Clostridia bacterium]
MLKYDIGEIKRRVGAKRIAFILFLVLGAALIAAATVVTVNLYENGGWLLLGILLYVAGFTVIGLPYKMYKPMVLKSREYYATVTKKHLFNGTFTDSTGKQGSKYGVLILTEDNGKNHAMRHLTTSQIEIYEEGDRVFHVGGTRFPIIIGRDISAQPCPLCGGENKQGEKKCSQCKLDIDWD